jgi:hypothetical protein
MPAGVGDLDHHHRAQDRLQLAAALAAFAEAEKMLSSNNRRTPTRAVRSPVLNEASIQRLSRLCAQRLQVPQQHIG